MTNELRRRVGPLPGGGFSLGGQASPGSLLQQGNTFPSLFVLIIYVRSLKSPRKFVSEFRYAVVQIRGTVLGRRDAFFEVRA